MKAVIFTMFLMMSTSSLAASLKPQEFIVKLENDDYEVESIEIRRIAADDSSKTFLCQNLHYFLEWYWAPREWTFDLDVKEVAAGEYKANVFPNILHNRTCKASLVTALKVRLLDVSRGTEFDFEAYIYTVGNETVLINGTCTYFAREEGSYFEGEVPYYYECSMDSLDRFVNNGNNQISITLN